MKDLEARVIPRNPTPSEHRVVLLDELTPAQRRVVLALIDAARAAADKAPPLDPSTAAKVAQPFVKRPHG